MFVPGVCAVCVYVYKCPFSLWLKTYPLLRPWPVPRTRWISFPPTDAVSGSEHAGCYLCFPPLWRSSPRGLWGMTTSPPWLQAMVTVIAQPMEWERTQDEAWPLGNWTGSWWPRPQCGTLRSEAQSDKVGPPSCPHRPQEKSWSWLRKINCFLTHLKLCLESLLQRMERPGCRGHHPSPVGKMLSRS